MLEAFALIAALFIGFGLGALALAVFFYAVEKLQSYGRDGNDT
jgi:Flp pilus assembly protein TadG